MTKRYAINFSLWISVLATIYVYLYMISPLGPSGALPCTFVAFPLYFLSGPRKETLAGFMSSAVMGIGWAAIYLAFIGWLTKNGLSAALSSAAAILFITPVLCALHFIVTPKGLFSSVPMMFGAIASTFLIGLDKWLYIACTLCLAIALAYACSLGPSFLDEYGRWVFGKRTARVS